MDWIRRRGQRLMEIHVLTALALVFMSLATGLMLMFPMALCGGVENYEPNTFIRWTEFGMCAAGLILGIVAARKA